ncbi:MAG: metallophosphoesterase family protein [Spirochaetaceae bacterium]|nr:metallophosphoesterase family protein [Spirochaetaceae bacterium]MBP5329606.1 metallophosphoesterase family protein [Spirochaetaceae bacterium]
MHLLILSDIHGDFSRAGKIEEEFKKADAVLFAGDFSKLFKTETGLPILNEVMEKNENLLAVLGNCDAPDLLKELEKKDVSVQGELVFRDGLFFAGAGGALKFTGDTANERDEDDLMSDLQVVRDRFAEYQDSENPGRWNNLVLIVHQPPKDTKLDKITAGIHVGSPALTEFIKEYQPLLLVSGHIHESAAIDTLGNTVMINPGSFAEGKYAVVQIQKENGEWKVASSSLKQV